MQKVPVIGQRFIREIPASDNVRDIQSYVVSDMDMTLDTNLEAAFLIGLLDSNGEVEGVEVDELGENIWRDVWKVYIKRYIN